MAIPRAPDFTFPHLQLNSTPTSPRLRGVEELEHGEERVGPLQAMVWAVEPLVLSPPLQCCVWLRTMRLLEQ